MPKLDNNRAYSLIEVKNLDDSKRTFRGWATTPSMDRMLDTVNSLGAKFTNPLVLLHQHRSDAPIGKVTFKKPTAKGIEFEAEIPKIEEPGLLKDRVDMAWGEIKHGLVRAVSIGFRSMKHAYKDDGGIDFQEIEIFELSTVSIPANADATINSWKSMGEAAQIQQIKSIDEKSLAALGRKGLSDRDSPGASGQTKQPASGGFSFSRSLKGTVMKNLAELRELRTTKNARLKELAELFGGTDYSPTDEENTEFDGLADEVKALDSEIRIAGYHAMNSAAAKSVDSQGFSGRTGPTILVRKADPDDKFKGQSFTRLQIAKAISFISMKSGDFRTASDIAQERWGKTSPNLVRYIKAAVAGGGTGSGEWGAELAQSDTRYSGDFVEFLYALTVFDRLPLRSIPARVHIKGQDGAATGYWVGESKAIPVSKPDFSDVELTPLKVGAIAVCSKELVMDSSPAAEMWIRDSLAQASAQRIDTTFLSATAASAGVSPAGLLNGLTAGTSAGTDADGLRLDIAALYSGFITAKNASGIWLVTTPSLAKSISLLVNALGQTEFVGLNANGGMLLGDNVLTGDNVGAGDLIALKPSDIWKIGDSGVEVSMSDTAMVEQDSAPQGATDTPVAASATLVSLWQEESVGFKVVRRINFAKRRTSAVAYIGDAAYAPTSGS